MEGEPEVPDCRPSPMQGSSRITCPIRYRGRLHVDDFGRARDNRSDRRRA